MDFRLSADQIDLQDHVRQYCAREFSPERLGAMDGRGIDRGGWSALAELGCVGLRVPEADGGLGLGWVEAAVVCEVLGYYLVPGPIVWSLLLAGMVDGIGDGTRVVTGVDRVEPAVPVLVEHLALADAVAILDADGILLVDAVADAEAGALTPLDPLTPVGLLAVDGSGTRLGDAAAARRLRIEGAVLTGALLTGIADRALDLAREYALGREQFDRPIAAFQAVQHLLADMYVRVMLARSAAYAAAAVLDDPTAGDAATAAGSVKVVASDAAMANSRTCIQVHGGMGFTWEMMPHYLLKRTWVLEHAFGTAAEHAEALATTLGSTP